MVNTLNKDLLAEFLSDSLDRLMRNKKVKVGSEIIPLSIEISHILFPSNEDEIPLGFRSVSNFQETLVFDTQYAGALIFGEEDGNPKLYSNIGGILYPIWT